MKTYEELKKNQYFTVEELIKRLQEFPPETKLSSLGADVGGYDVSEQPYVGLDYTEGKILLSHFESDAWKLLGNMVWKNGRCTAVPKITSKQFKEFDLNE